MAGFHSGGSNDSAGSNGLTYMASHNQNEGIYWSTLLDLHETSICDAVLCTINCRGRTIAELRHRHDQKFATSLCELADNAVAELHCFSNGTDGEADDNRLSTDAAFRRSITCAKVRTELTQRNDVRR